MNKVIDFIVDLVKVAVAALTGIFAVFGAGQLLQEYLPWFNEIGDPVIGLGLVYFFFVMLMVKIGMDYYKTFINNVGKKK